MAVNFCPKCGSSVTPGDTHCRNCGAVLAQTERQQQDSQQTYQQENQTQNQQGYPQQEYQQPYQPYPGQGPVGEPISDRSWGVALLLCLFLGGAGIHRFYLGYTRRGVVQLVLIILGAILAVVVVGFVFLAITGIMGVVDFFMLLFNKIPDSEGRKLK